ncbi:S-adenosylmethionine decarboxylase [Candidatus Saccharibacteria bacterium RIFCSPHIGHO2_12_FULL_41_12]|nr:MAG: S-adenosylmethionine decarboxylase [Candidatus Saccharibacteria bacterium RIFCSPHIGHO2_12_FULL_41_12]
MNNIEKEFAENNAWGISANVDLYNCDPNKIRDADLIKEYVKELCDFIKVTRFGKCTVVHFGEKEEIAGYSMTQLIETSLVSGHFANKTNAAYLDVFSCQYFDPELVASFSKRFFGAKKVKLNYTLRK